jgi:histone demethylase JARID1
MSPEDCILQGKDADLIHATGAERERVLEIFSTTISGRQRAEDIYGPNVWSDRSRKLIFENLSKPDTNHPDDDKEVNKMFLDLTNVDEDDVAKKDRQEERELVSITAESFEAERNAMDMEDSE